MNRIEFLASLAAVPLAQVPSSPSPAPAASMAPAGDLVLRPFATAPFPHASRANGHTYDHMFYDAATHYSDSTVGVYLPPGYVKKPTVDFIVHFHGWRNNVANAIARYRLTQQVAQSNVNAVLLVPQGPRDAPDSGDGKLENDDRGFARFIDEALGFLRQSGRVAPGAALGNIVLSAHSGGYAGLGGSLIHGGLNDRVTDVMLFDAAYAYLDAITAWAALSPHNHLLSIFTDDTAANNATLQTRLGGIKRTGVPALTELDTRKPVFIYTNDVAHDELMQRYNWFELFLQSTALVPR